MKILGVVGTRPNFVKIAPILAEARTFRCIKFVLVHTGQHCDAEMSACFFKQLGIQTPDITLECTDPASSARQADAASAHLRVCKMARRLELVMTAVKPNAVLVVGDVDSTLAGALAATHLRIPLIHLEAGLRSFDLRMPEEANRIITDAVSNLLLVSEPSGVWNLLNEGKRPDQILMVGNVMIDTLMQSLGAARQSKILSELGLQEHHERHVRKYALATLHRASTVDSPETLRSLWEALAEISAKVPIVFPVHPRTHNRLNQLGLEAWQANKPAGRPVQTIPPQSYLDFLWLERNATVVITDSGGVQEETTALGVPCLTLRNGTERPITVTEGSNTIVGLDPQRLFLEVERVLSGKGKTGRVPDLWDGCTAKRVVDAMLQHLCDEPKLPYTSAARGPDRTQARAIMTSSSFANA
jgi:UDP-N-acetylglucosamine 2-epimerase (non-hydrolysing)